MNVQRQAVRMLTFLVMMALPFAARAQYGASMYGTGMYGANQACPYPNMAGEGASSYIDEIRESERDKRDAERALREKKDALKKVEKKLDAIKDTVSKTIALEFADTLFAHMDHKRDCSEYQLDDPKRSAASPYNNKEWKSICQNPNFVGRLNGAVACDLPRSRVSDRSRGSTLGSCTEALAKYAKTSSDQQKLQRDVERLEEQIKDLKDDDQNGRRKT